MSFDDSPLTSRYRVFRPPAEANSLIVQVATGCPHNHCLFCGMYKNVPYDVRPWSEVLRELRACAELSPGVTRIFLADGDVMHLPFEFLRTMLTDLRRLFPKLARVSLYANGRSILAKAEFELVALRKLGLHTLYLGLESGDEETLRFHAKPETAEEMIKAVKRAQGQGLRLSVMVLLGLGGQEHWEQHAKATGDAVNRMRPRLLSALRVVPIPGTPLRTLTDQGRFVPLTEYGTVVELRTMVRGFDLRGTVFRANHVSNVLPVEARFPRDKERLLRELQEELDSGSLSRTEPGPMPFVL